MRKVINVILLFHAWLFSNAQNTNSFVDVRDNKTYKVVTIGSQIWFAENLAFEIKKGSWVYEKDTSNLRIHGRLYNWNTACEVCPTGWRLPSIEDYKKLLHNVGQPDSTKLFDDLVVGGKSGFDINFSGWYAGRRYGQINEHADFWTSTSYQPFKGARKTGIRLSLYKRDEDIYWDPDFSDYGFSVRCIKE
ncbi:MAG TPA: FISUMP domain-containing protein [Chryseolinea sp.]|nr:FISUMP domain-containing protein [Chryseolinea sp.]